MTSPRKIAANRLNGCNSRGPRSKEGKVAASRNALRHGLNTISYRNSEFAREIEVRARALCEGDANPYLFHHAIRVAECDVVLCCVRRQRVEVIERCRDGRNIAYSKGDNSFALAKLRAAKTELAFTELERMGINIYDFNTVKQHLKAEGADSEHQQYPPLMPLVKERDDVEAFFEAIPDLKKLDRYERRALSARKRALRDFVGTLSWTEDEPQKKVTSRSSI